MHESIARAVYKGFKRQYLNAQKVYDVTKMPNPPSTRKAWSRYVKRMVTGMPDSVALIEYHQNEGAKNARYTWVMADPNPVGGWDLFRVTAEAKTFSVDSALLRLHLTDHIIKRCMQREDVDKPILAMRFLAGALHYADALANATDDDVMVPTPKGVMFLRTQGINGRECGDRRVLTTYVDEEKLTIDQQLAAELLRSRAEDLLIAWEKRNDSV